MGIVIAVVITFFLTVLWQMWASRANKLPLRAVINALTNELDMMAEKLGYANITDYWKATNGDKYAKDASKNVKNALKSLE
jgi:hypothetical protein